MEDALDNMDNTLDEVLEMMDLSLEALI